MTKYLAHIARGLVLCFCLFLTSLWIRSLVWCDAYVYQVNSRSIAEWCSNEGAVRWWCLYDSAKVLEGRYQPQMGWKSFNNQVKNGERDIGEVISQVGIMGLQRVSRELNVGYGAMFRTTEITIPYWIVMTPLLVCMFFMFYGPIRTAIKTHFCSS